MGVKAIRKTRSGDVLIELIKLTIDSKRSFTDALKNAIGKADSVRVLTPRVTLEIRDVDSCTTIEEVLQALRSKMQEHEGQFKVRLTKPNAAGQCMAVFSIEEKSAARLLETGRIHLGWVSCRLWRWEQVTRCFRCLGCRACKGPDRSSLC